MNDQNKTREQLLAELAALRQRIDGLEAQVARSSQAADEHRQVVDALRESEERFQAFTNNSPSATWIKDEQGRYILLNKSYERLLGLQQEACQGKTDFDLWPLDVAEQFWKNDQAMLASNQLLDVVEETLDSAGQRHYWWSYKFPFQDHRGQRYVGGVATEITEWVKAEAALQQAKTELEKRVDKRTAELSQANQQLQAELEKRRRTEEELAMFRRFVEAATQGFGMVDLQGRVIYVNPFWSRLFEAPEPEAVIGTDLSNYYPPDYVRRRETEIIPALRRGEYWQAEQAVRLPSGRLRPTIHTIFPVRDERGELLCTAAIITDITDLKRVEEDLNAERQALRRMVLAGDHERRLITYELHDGVAQQLLAALMLFQSAEPPDGSPAKTKNTYHDALQVLRQASAEIRSLMSRLRTPVLDMHGLVEAIGDVVSQLQASPGAPHVEYRHDVRVRRLEPTLENSLFRIAQEAMTNAHRYSKSPRIQVELTQEDDQIQLEVRDWGIGFDPQTVTKNRFGLEGIRERARILGGQVNIQSGIGQGTVVRVRFPVLEAAPADD